MTPTQRFFEGSLCKLLLNRVSYKKLYVSPKFDGCFGTEANTCGKYISGAQNEIYW